MNRLVLYQCFGSRYWSVGSTRFWLPGSGSAKICGSESKGENINLKLPKKTFKPLKPISEKFPKWFRIKISEQKNKTKN